MLLSKCRSQIHRIAQDKPIVDASGAAIPMRDWSAAHSIDCDQMHTNLNDVTEIDGNALAKLELRLNYHRGDVLWMNYLAKDNMIYYQQVDFKTKIVDGKWRLDTHTIIPSSDKLLCPLSHIKPDPEISSTVDLPEQDFKGIKQCQEEKVRVSPEIACKIIENFATKSSHKYFILDCLAKDPKKEHSDPEDEEINIGDAKEEFSESQEHSDREEEDIDMGDQKEEFPESQEHSDREEEDIDMGDQKEKFPESQEHSDPDEKGIDIARDGKIQQSMQSYLHPIAKTMILESNLAQAKATKQRIIKNHQEKMKRFIEESQRVTTEIDSLCNDIRELDLAQNEKQSKLQKEKDEKPEIDSEYKMSIQKSKQIEVEIQQAREKLKNMIEKRENTDRAVTEKEERLQKDRQKFEKDASSVQNSTEAFSETLKKFNL